MHYRKFSNIPGLNPLEARSTPPPKLCQSNVIPDFTKCPLGAKSPLVENHCYSERVPSKVKISLQWPSAMVEKSLKKMHNEWLSH